MTIGAAIFLAALGAILRYAVSDSVEGIDLETIGLILMIAGIAGLILEFVRQGIWRDRASRRDGEVVERERVRERDRR